MINLIINADDFGMSKHFNKVIINLIKKKKVTSTSVLVKRITAEQKNQVEELKELSKKMNMSVGLHLEFQSLKYKEDIKEQFKLFQEIFNTNPSHIDIHKASMMPASIPIVTEFCKEKKIPCRNNGGKNIYWKKTDTPVFHGTRNKFEDIESWLKTLEDGKWYEILFHPGVYDHECTSSLNKEREQDTEHILKVNTILKKYNIKSVSYHDLTKEKSIQT